MKKLIGFSFVIFVTVLFSFSAFATTTENYNVIDEVDVLTAEEESQLQLLVDESYGVTGQQLVIATVNGTGEEGIYGYSEKLFLENYGESGVILLVDMEALLWDVMPIGEANNLVSSNELNALIEELSEYFGTAAYYQGFSAFIDLSETYLTEDVDVSSAASPTVSSELPNIVDAADLLTDEEEALLQAKATANKLSTGQEFVIVTASGIQTSNFSDYTYNFFLENYGDDGVILLIDMEARHWQIEAVGYTSDAILNDDISYIGDMISGDLSATFYYNAFDEFLDLSLREINRFAEKTNGSLSLSEFLTYGGIGFGCALVVGLIVVFVLKAQLKNNAPQKSAGKYITNVNFRYQNDIFLYSRTTRTARAKSSSSGGGGGGGGGGRSSGGGSF